MYRRRRDEAKVDPYLRRAGPLELRLKTSRPRFNPAADFNVMPAQGAAAAEATTGRDWSIPQGPGCYFCVLLGCFVPLLHDNIIPSPFRHSPKKYLERVLLIEPRAFAYKHPHGLVIVLHKVLVLFIFFKRTEWVGGWPGP